MLLSIDHGNKSIKGVYSDPFVCGLSQSDSKPFGDGVLKYRNRYYLLSEERLPYRRDKTEDENYFILTLFAIAREIEAMGKYQSGVISIQLAVGLPPAYYGAQKASFVRYFSNRGTIAFSYRGKPFNILITEVACYPQSYAAAVTAFQELKDIPRAIVLDIGGYTADYLQIRNGAGDLAVCDSLEQGVILLYNKVKSRSRAENDVLLSEAEIDDILMGRQSAARLEIVALVENLAREFVANLMNTLREHQLELKSGCVVFVGGGSLLLRNQIEGSGKVGRMIFVEDVRANAKGYELLYQLSHKSR